MKQAQYKAQNQFSDALVRRCKAEISNWLQEWDLTQEEANTIAEELFGRCMAERIERTSANPRGPEILWSDGQKLQQILDASRLIAAKMDENEELMALLEAPSNAVENTAAQESAGDAVQVAEYATCAICDQAPDSLENPTDKGGVMNYRLLSGPFEGEVVGEGSILPATYNELDDDLKERMRLLGFEPTDAGMDDYERSWDSEETDDDITMTSV